MSPFRFLPIALCLIAFTACVPKQRLVTTETERNEVQEKLDARKDEKTVVEGKLQTAEATMRLKDDQITDLKDQLADARKQRDAQLDQVTGLTQLSQSASSNIDKTLAQLATKDKYIHLLQAAKSRTDSLNLALAVNLKTVLKDGIEDDDVEVKVDKTVVFINLSDKMLFQSGSADITSRADTVLSKIAKIVESRPGVEVMVEGYTDNVPISKECVGDNWELSVLRSTAVVKALQDKHAVDPNRLIAAGRGEYNALATNDTEAGRAMNRRTRIVILPKLDEFYDLLDPSKAPAAGN